MGLLDRFLRKGESTPSATGLVARVIAKEPPKQPILTTYGGCEISIIPPQNPDDAITIERVTPGKEKTFWQLVEAMHNRMDLGLTEDGDKPRILRDRRTNLVNGNNDRMWVWRTDMVTVQAAVEKLAAEKAAEPTPAGKPAPTTAGKEVGLPRDTPPPPKRDKHKKKEKPEPSIEGVAHALRNKRGERPTEGTIARFLVVMSAALARHEDPHGIFNDPKALAKFSVAERKAFKNAVNDVYGQKGAER